MIERFLPRYVVHQECAGGTSIVTARDRLEGFLAGSVPNLQLDLLVVNFHRAGSELDTDG